MGDEKSADRVTIGIDIGTTSVKAVAATADGTVVARTRIPHVVHAPHSDVFEHDPVVAWHEGVLGAYSDVAAGLDAAAVTVAAMVPSMCGVDGHGRPVTPGLLYGDARGRHGGDGAGEALGFARWLCRRPGVVALWPAQAVANHALCGVGAIGTSTAMTMMPLFDRVGWDATVCAELGIGTESLPQLSAGAAPVGSFRGVLVSGGTIDATAEQIVAGADAPGDVLVVCGTTLITWVVAVAAPSVPGLWTVPHPAPGMTAIGGASNAGGLFVDRIRRLVGDPGEEAEAAVRPDQVPVWLPYVRGERTPLHDPHRRAELLELGLEHGPAEVMRAAHEATGFVVRHHVELAGIGAARIVAVGGGTRSAGWMQALADATGLPVDVAAAPDGAAIGAAYLSRVTAGLVPDTSAAARWARTERRVLPRVDWVGPCSARYRRFLEATRR